MNRSWILRRLSFIRNGGFDWNWNLVLININHQARPGQARGQAGLGFRWARQGHRFRVRWMRSDLCTIGPEDVRGGWSPTNPPTHPPTDSICPPPLFRNYCRSGLVRMVWYGGLCRFLIWFVSWVRRCRFALLFGDWPPSSPGRQDGGAACQDNGHWLCGVCCGGWRRFPIFRECLSQPWTEKYK